MKKLILSGGDFTNPAVHPQTAGLSAPGLPGHIDHTMNRAFRSVSSPGLFTTSRTLTPTGDTGGILNTGLHTPT